MSKRDLNYPAHRQDAERYPNDPVTSDVSRRDFLKFAALAGGGAVMGKVRATDLPAVTASGADSGKLDITIAGYPVDHVRALAEERVQVEGCNVTFRQGKIGDMNTHVFSGPEEYEVSEIGLSPFMLAYAN